MLDDMLSLQGNTAVYLLYAHARIAAIGRKAGIEDISALAHDHPIEVDHEKERTLAMHVSPTIDLMAYKACETAAFEPHKVIAASVCVRSFDSCHGAPCRLFC